MVTKDIDPVLLAIESAPTDDMPESDGERLAIEEAITDGVFLSGASISESIKARTIT